MAPREPGAPSNGDSIGHSDAEDDRGSAVDRAVRSAPDEIVAEPGSARAGLPRVVLIDPPKVAQDPSANAAAAAIGPAPDSGRHSVDTRSGDRPIFLARASYRRRRLMDAARLLPLAGALAFAVPMLWIGAGDSADPSAPSQAVPGAARTAVGGIYVFVVWALLIVAAAWVARALSGRDPGMNEADPTASDVDGNIEATEAVGRAEGFELRDPAP